MGCCVFSGIRQSCCQGHIMVTDTFLTKQVQCLISEVGEGCVLALDATVTALDVAIDYVFGNT